MAFFLACRSTVVNCRYCSLVFLMLEVGRRVLQGRERGCEAPPTLIRMRLKLQFKAAHILNIPFHTLRIYCNVVRELFEVFDHDAQPRFDWPPFRSDRRSRLHPCAHQAWSHACSIVTPLPTTKQRTPNHPITSALVKPLTCGPTCVGTCTKALSIACSLTVSDRPSRLFPCSISRALFARRG